MYQTIGIICAMEKEFALIRESLAGGHPEPMGRFTAYVGQSGDKTIIAAVSGIGKVNAAVCAQMMIWQYHAQAIINSGVCGALDAGLHRMDIVLADELLYHDLEESHIRDDFPHCSRFHADPQFNGLADSICREEGVPCVHGRIVTGDAFILDAQIKSAIAARTGGIALEMEGAAVGHSCFLADIPFVVLRCVSDGIADSELDYNAFAAQAARRCAHLALRLAAQM